MYYTENTATVLSDDELFHYGVKGMKWGRRKAKYEQQYEAHRQSAILHDRMARVHEDEGKYKRAEEYREDAEANREMAEVYKGRIERADRALKFEDDREAINQTRSTGSKILTNIMSGPFANKTYNSLIAAGRKKSTATAITLVTGLMFGGLGHLAVSSLATTRAANKGMKPINIRLDKLTSKSSVYSQPKSK